MALRILGGNYRSRLLKSPPGQDTRPTRSLVRESIFNILQGAFEGARVLDLFAGSGAMGLEALSRGASEAVFCDNSRIAAQVIRENILALGVSGSARVLQLSWEAALAQFAAKKQAFDVIFIDPPYQMPPERVLSTVKASGVLTEGGLVVLEQSAKKPFALPEGLETFKDRQYGETRLYFIRKERPAT